VRQPAKGLPECFPGASWRTAPASATGFDPAAFAAFAQRVENRAYGAVDGLVVVRFGHLVLEQYNGRWHATRAHTVQSVTKSVTSLLFGILQAQHPGAPTSLDRPVLDLFARYTGIANVDDRKRALTLRHLLAMRTNMDYWEQPYPDSPHDSLNKSAGDWTRFILSRKMTGAPGTTWAYNSGAAILTCSIIREITGEGIIYQQVGYLMRSGSPDSLDLMVAINYAVMAADLVIERQFGRLVALRNGNYTNVPLPVVRQGVKRVDVGALYDVEAYRPKIRHVDGKPMFLY